MSPSRRSSRSTRSHNPPAWRSASVSKNSAPVSLSYVLAQPEQALPLANASTTFPVNRNTNHTVSNSNNEETVGSQTAETNHSITTPINERNTTPIDGAPHLSSPITHGTEQSTPTTTEPRDSITANTTTQANSSGISAPVPRKASWFGSLSRSKGRNVADATNLTRDIGPSQGPPISASIEGSPALKNTEHPGIGKLATYNDVEVPAATEPSETIPTPSPSAIAPTAIPSAPPSQPRVVTSQPAQKRSWFSSTPTSVTLHVPTSSTPPSRPATTPHHSHTTSIPSSIDNDVPLLSPLTSSRSASPAFPPLVTSSPSVIITSPEHITTSSSSTDPSLIDRPSPSTVSSPSHGDAGRPRLSSLNPSTSRFVLSIPLLGRPKIPLKHIQNDEPEDTRSGGLSAECSDSPQLETKMESTTTSHALEQSTITTTSKHPNEDVISENSETPPQSDSTLSGNTSRVAESSSWWDYIGWGATATVPASRPSASSGDDNHVEGKPVDPAALPTTERHTLNNKTPDAVVAPHPKPSHSAESTTPTPVPVDKVASAEAAMKDGLPTGKNYPAPLNPPNHVSMAGEADTILPAENAKSNSAGDTSPSAISSDVHLQQTQPAWYSPWAWYGSSIRPARSEDGSEGIIVGSRPEEESKASGNEVGSEADAGMKGGVVANNEQNRSKDVPTQSELVKEAALARDTSANPNTNPLSGDEQRNPIESSFETSRVGWASFFSTKSLVVKRITGEAEEVKKDKNGVEIMDIDIDGADAESGEETRGRKGKPASDAQKNTKINTLTAVGDSARPLAPPLTISDSLKKEVEKATLTTQTKKKAIPTSRKPSPSASVKKSSSPTPSKRSSISSNTPARPSVPNLVLPTWSDTFHTGPRSNVPPPPATTFGKTMKFVSGVLFAGDNKNHSGNPGRRQQGPGGWKGKGREEEFAQFGKELPKAWDVLGNKLDSDLLRGCKRVVVIGVHGWFPGAVMRTVLGEPTGTSGKFVNMMVQALEDFQKQHDVKLEKITKIPLEGEGTINGRVERLYTNLRSNQEWMNDLHAADAILVATHSQGSIVSTHLLDHLIQDRHINTSRNMSIIGGGTAESFPSGGIDALVSPRVPQRVCCLALCGIHLGPLRYLSSSSLLQPYIQYFESTAARELFEFQNTESEVSKAYVEALRRVVNQGVKMLYVASLNDQVVPIYSGLFTAVSHPLILRALYIDGDAYHSSDFLSNLLVLLLRILNSGISDSGLVAHLSEATAGSLNGVGHSTAYEEISTYSLAVKYLFLTNDGLEEHSELVLEPFNATSEQNDYEIPWSLRDVIADERVMHFFMQEITELRDAFREWHPKTTILRDLKRKLQPIQRLPPSSTYTSSSKL